MDRNLEAILAKTEADNYVVKTNLGKYSQNLRISANIFYAFPFG